MSGAQNSQSDRLQVGESSSLEKPVIVGAEAESLAQAEVKPAESVLADNNANTDNVYASIDASRYEAQADGSYESSQYGLYDEPVQHNVDESLSNEVIDSAAETDALPLAQDENENSPGLLNEPVVEAESSMSELQRTIDSLEQLEPEQPASSVASENNTTQLSEQPVNDVKGKTDNSWSVHLFAYRNIPPVSKFEFLDNENVPYEIKKTLVKGEVWYRVTVNTYSERSTADKYAEMLKEKFAIKGIWLSKN